MQDAMHLQGLLDCWCSAVGSVTPRVAAALSLPDVLSHSNALHPLLRLLQLSQQLCPLGSFHSCQR